MKSLAALLPFLLSAIAYADSFGPPMESVVSSPNGKFFLFIAPRNTKLSPQLQATTGSEEQRREFDLVRSCHAILFAGGGKAPVWRWKLVNDHGPMQAFVSDDGRYVVTTDDYAAAGHGDNVLVIYKAQGELVRRFKLTELLTAEEIKAAPASTSSIHWIRGKVQIDIENELVSIELRNRILRVRLASGEILKEGARP
jgi:hypothetical protein